MARTNTKTKVPVFSTERLAGGFGMLAATQTPESELRRLVMACLLWEDIAYATGNQVAEDIKAIIPKVKPQVCFEIAVAARTEQKLRHVPLFVIREMCRYPEHRKFVRQALKLVCTRPDQLTEFLSIYWKTNNGKKAICKQAKLGLADCFDNFDEYQLGKWNRDSDIKLRDVMFLCHPNPKTPEQALLFKKLTDGTLATPETWEVGLSAAKTNEEKALVWERLIENKKLGALATLKNLRNMQEVLPKSSVRKAIANASPSMLLPIDFIKAVDHAGDFVRDIENLMFSCLSQYKKLAGETIFVLDVSGSMGVPVGGKTAYSRIDVGISMAIMAMEMCESCVIYLTAGSDHASLHKTMKITPHRGFGLASEIRGKIPTLGGGGIFTRQCLEYINKEEKVTPDRVIVFSDSADCDRSKVLPKPFAKNNYIIDISSHKNGVNYKGIWTAEISGWSEHFLKFISEIES